MDNLKRKINTNDLIGKKYPIKIDGKATTILPIQQAFFLEDLNKYAISLKGYHIEGNFITIKISTAFDIVYNKWGIVILKQHNDVDNKDYYEQYKVYLPRRFEDEKNYIKTIDCTEDGRILRWK